jgi:TonB family protein
VDEPPRRDDRLLLAVACSLALHLGLLTLLPVLLDEGRKAVLELPKLTARLAEPKPAPPRATEPPAPQPSQPVPKAARPAPQKPVPRVQEEPRRAEPVAPPVIAVPAAPSAAPPVTVIPVPAAPPVATAPARAPSAAPAPSGPDASSVKLYQSSLALAADELKRYPRVAVDNNWTGSVSLRIVVGAGGKVSSVTVTRSAGFRPLDDEAQRMFRAALDKLPVPPELRGWEFTLHLRAEFYFKE